MATIASSPNVHPWKDSKNLLEHFFYYSVKRNTPEQWLELFDTNCLMIEKLDGSNLSIGFCSNHEDRKIRFRIASRRVVLIEEDYNSLHLVELPKFNGVSLTTLKPIIAILFQTIPTVPEFAEFIQAHKWTYFVGEFLPVSKSWYCFGLIVERAVERAVERTVERTVEEITAAAVTEIEPEDARCTSIMLSLAHRTILQTAGILLPELKFEGPLYLGILKLNNFLLSNVAEGIVITLNRYTCVKYKSPRHEHQRAIKVSPDVVQSIEIPEIVHAFELVLNMFEESQKFKVRPKQKRIIAEKKPNPIAGMFQLVHDQKQFNSMIRHLETHMPITKENQSILCDAIFNELLQMYRVEEKDFITTTNPAAQKKLHDAIGTAVDKLF